MEDIKVGLVVRAVRLRRGWRQADLASAAGVSRQLVSVVERGCLEDLSLRSIRRVTAALGVRLPFDPRWRGADLATLLDERHAAISREVASRLTGLGWQVTAEVTFAIGRESGAIDILGWQPDRRALLVGEVKSEVADLQDLLATFDRKRRLAMTIARERGMRPLVVGAVILLPEENRVRNTMERYRPVIDPGYPARTLEVRRWLRDPDRDLRGLWFLPVASTSSTKRHRAPAARSKRNPTR